MPFDSSPRPRIAVVGAGISGLSAAYHLAPQHNVTLFEAEDRLGGHARTMMAGPNRDQPVDTGFIVFNEPNYPQMNRMFADLNVPVKDSDMSFAVSIDKGRVEYGTHSLRAFAAQKLNLLRPAYWRMIRDILRFNKIAATDDIDPDMPLGRYLDQLDLGQWFRDYYLLPMSGAIWSSTPDQMADYPARALVNFFKNHALLQWDTFQWKTVDGGSIEYVRRIGAAIEKAGGTIKTSSPIKKVIRSPFGVALLVNGQVEHFDQVVFACHSDTALRLLEHPTSDEKAVLGAIRYQSNIAVLHRDKSQMPKRREAWASWVYVADQATPTPSIAITYWMNSLQGITSDEPIFVSLNPAKPIPEHLIYDQKEFWHPVFDQAALKAQAALPLLQGVNGTWFCGAWSGNGFHEDGFASGAAVASQMMSQRIAAQ